MTVVICGPYECSFITEAQYETVKNKNCTWISPKCEFFIFSDSFFGEQVNLKTENRFVPLTKEKIDRSSSYGTNKSSIISGLKFIRININSLRGKNLELLAFLDFHQPHVVAIQETKIDSSIVTSELFPETCPYRVYRKNRNIHSGGVMLLVQKDISHMPITELENDLESIWVKVFANKTSHFVASWYRPPGSTSKECHLLREQLDYIRTHHKGKKLLSVHVVGDFSFKDIDIMNEHGLEQMVHSTHPPPSPPPSAPNNKPRRKVYLYQKGDYESMRKDTLTRILVQYRRTLIC